MASESSDEGPEARTYRLGDDIEDWCSRCRGISNHAVSALLDGAVLKVHCRACLSEHKFRHGKGGKSREKERQKLFDEVLKSSPFRR